MERALLLSAILVVLTGVKYLLYLKTQGVNNLFHHRGLLSPHLRFLAMVVSSLTEVIVFVTLKQLPEADLP